MKKTSIFNGFNHVERNCQTEKEGIFKGPGGSEKGD